MIIIHTYLKSAVVFAITLFFSLASQACLNLYHITNADERYLYGLMFKIAGVHACANQSVYTQRCKAEVFSDKAMQLGVSDQALKTLSLVSARTIRHCSFAERQQLKFTGSSAQRIACIYYRDRSNRNALAMLLDKHNQQYKVHALQTISRHYTDDALERLKQRQSKPWFQCTHDETPATGSHRIGFHIINENSGYLSYHLANELKGRCQIEKVKVVDKRNDAASQLVFAIEADIKQCQHPQILHDKLRRKVSIQGSKDKVSIHWAKDKTAKGSGCKLDPGFDLNQFFKDSKASYHLSKQD